MQTTRFRFWLWLIALVGVIVARRLLPIGVRPIYQLCERFCGQVPSHDRFRASWGAA